MYAVIATGGKQYRVQQGETIQVEKLDGAEARARSSSTEVLLVADGENVKVGAPHVAGAKVTAEVVGQRHAARSSSSTSTAAARATAARPAIASPSPRVKITGISA